MDTPADPATPLREVYQAFFDDLAREGRKPSTIGSETRRGQDLASWSRQLVNGAATRLAL